MNKIIKIVVLLLLFCSCALAQNNTDTKLNFNGTWVLDEEKSYPLRIYKELYENYILEISDDGTIFKVNKNYLFKGQTKKYEAILFTDERGETNTVTTLNESRVVKSKTSRKKGSVISRFKYETEEKHGKARHSGNEKYTLSKDGKVLTLAILTYSEIPVPHFPIPGNARFLDKLIFYRKD